MAAENFEENHRTVQERAVHRRGIRFIVKKKVFGLLSSGLQ
jgi:hypothetical protein